MSAVYFFDKAVPSTAQNGELHSTSICEIEQRIRIRIGQAEVELDEVNGREFMAAFADAMKRAW